MSRYIIIAICRTINHSQWHCFFFNVMTLPYLKRSCLSCLVTVTTSGGRPVLSECSSTLEAIIWVVISASAATPAPQQLHGRRAREGCNYPPDWRNTNTNSASWNATVSTEFRFSLSAVETAINFLLNSCRCSRQLSQCYNVTKDKDLFTSKFKFFWIKLITLFWNMHTCMVLERMNGKCLLKILRPTINNKTY